MKEWYSAPDLAAQQLPGLPGTQQGINKMAERLSWARRQGNGSGQAWEYPLSALPEVARLVLLRRHYATLAESGAALARREALAELLGQRAEAAQQEAGMVRFAGLTAPAQGRAEARAALVTACRDYRRAAGLPDKRGREMFALDYNSGAIKVEEWVQAVIPHTCAGSLRNWEKGLKTEGLARLAGHYGHRKGQGIIDTDKEINTFVLGMLVTYPHTDATKVVKGLRARFKDRDLPSLRRVQDWLKAYREKNAQLVTKVTNPDEWRSKFMAAGGSASAAITALNQRWELDGTKGDLMLSDGTRHTLVFAIDLYSRRQKIRVSRSSNADSVCSVLRACFLDWGVPMQIGTDNGSDFVSKRVKRVIAGMGIEHDIAPPFTPDHKPFVERGIQTFLHDMLELLTGYVGHNVTERKDIEARKSFAQRLMKGGGDPVELRLSPEELQEFCDTWTDKVNAHDPHAGLGGKTPFEMVAAWTQPIRTIRDERALDVLLSPAPGGDGLRVIGKKGIRLENGLFDDDALGGLEGQQVRVLLDEADIGRIHVFDLDGGFLCTAVCPERADVGIDRKTLAAKRKARQKAVMTEGAKLLRQAAKTAKVEDIAQEIMIDRAEAADKVVWMPGATTPHVTQALEQAARAAAAVERVGQAPAAAPVGSAEAGRLAALEAEMAAPAQVVRLDTAGTRFKRALDLEARQRAGEPLGEAEARWLADYQRGAEYRSRMDFTEDFGLEVAMQA